MINPHTFGSDVVDNVTDIVADHINNLRAWLSFTAALGLNANTETLAANKTLVDGDEPIQCLDPSGSEFTVELPAGGITNHIFYFVNTSASDNLEVKDDGTVTIVTILPSMSAIVVSDGASWKLITHEVLDEDDFVSDSDTKVPTQQSVKAFGNATYAVKEQKKSVSILFEAPSTGDGAYYFAVPAEMDSWELTGIFAHAVTPPSGGAVTVQIHNLTDSQDMLSTELTIDDGENSSATAATAAVINTSYDDLDTNDIIRIDLDGVNGAENLTILLTFTGELS